MKFYFSDGGYLGGGDPLWGSPPILESLDLYLAMLGDAPIPWAVAVLGGSLLETPSRVLALERGGHLRVGIEDWDGGPTNAEQVTARGRALHGHGPRRRDDRAIVDVARAPVMNDVEANKALVKRFIDALGAAMSPPPPRASTPSATTRTPGKATSR